MDKQTLRLPQDFYIGQQVASRYFGIGVVSELDTQLINAVEVKFDSGRVERYTIDGRQWEWDAEPGIAPFTMKP